MSLSVVVPVYNEAALLERAVAWLVDGLASLDHSFELILAENGSNDGTAALADAIDRGNPRVRALHIPEPNYGRALRAGIDAAQGDVVVCDEIDLGDLTFYRQAFATLAHCDMVVGSKCHPESRDHRPWLRRMGTRAMSRALRLTTGFAGTDTHGLKAFWRARLLPVVHQCRVEHHLFASELVIRAARAGLRVREVPLQLREVRPPSVGVLRRVPRVAADLATLTWSVRVRG